MHQELAAVLDHLRQAGLYRHLRTVESDQGPEISYQGKTYLNFSSNNYLGLAHHPLLKKTAISAVREYGTGSGASRLITGSMSLHEELEKAIADFKGCEAGLLFNSGYHANIGVIPALMHEGDFIFSDELNHASLIDGCRLSKARTLVYRHGDVGHLEELLKGIQENTSAHQHISTSAHRLILTETLFSMDGDLAPLPQIMELAEKYGAWVMVDEAHATGFFGERGRGLVEHFGIGSDHPRLIQMGTFGKALGSFGAYVCGSKVLIEFLINKSRSFIYTTALPPSVVAASLAAVSLVCQDQSLRERLWENVGYFADRASLIADRRSQIVDCNNDSRFTIHDSRSTNSPIFPIIIGDSQKTMEVAQKLFEKGILACGIRPPSVPEGKARIRLTLMATHTKDHLDRALDAIAECCSL